MSTLEIRAAESVALVAIDTLTRDVELSCRAKGISKRTVAEYAEALRAGAAFPPIVVFRDSKGQQWLADGFHRCAAAELAGHTEINADVREGSRKDALLFAATANASHGLRRTNADKRKAVLLVIHAFPKYSNRKVAETCGVDDKTVAAVKRSAEVPHSEADEPAAMSEVDAIVLRLTKAIERAARDWPAERREQLQALLLDTAASAEGKAP